MPFEKKSISITYVIFFFLSLDAHNHVDDYSGTLGGVCKVHISALVTIPKNWVVALSFSLSLSQKKEKKNALDCYLPY